MKKSELFFNVVRLPTDFIMLLVAGVFTYIFRTKILSIYRPVLFEFNLPLVEYFYLVLVVSFLFISAYAISGLYMMNIKMSRIEEFLKIIVASSAGIMLVIVYIFLRQELFNSRFLVLGAYLSAIVMVYIGREIIRIIQNYSLIKYSFGAHRIIIIGKSEAGDLIAKNIENDPSCGYKIIQRIRSIDTKELRGLNYNDVDEVILVDSNCRDEEVIELIDFCHEHHISFKFIPNLQQFLTTNIGIDVVANYPIIELKRTKIDGWGGVVKRLVDVFFAILGLVLFSPIFLIVSFIIKWESEGPVFARLKRISKNKEFYLYKFRSMIANAEDLKPLLDKYNERQGGPLFKMSNDPRITKTGKFIRKYRIDELPQFWNILKGEMSLIGPRPHQPDEISRYQKWHKKVLAIKAGATGLAQVSGSSDLDFDKEVTLDTFYIENWSLLLDFKIIIKTILKVFKDRSAV